MAVPTNVTAGITALQTTPPLCPAPTRAEVQAVVVQQLKAAILATGSIPANLPDIIRNAMAAPMAAQIEQTARADLLDELQRIAAAG